MATFGCVAQKAASAAQYFIQYLILIKHKFTVYTELESEIRPRKCPPLTEETDNIVKYGSVLVSADRI
jgi:hypothetical protein